MKHLEEIRQLKAETPPERTFTRDELRDLGEFERRIRQGGTVALTGTELVSDDDGAAEAPIALIEDS